MKYILFTLSVILAMGSELFAQGVLIGDTAQAPNPSAILELRSNEGGFLVSRMTTTERNAVANPASGLQIFNTTTECLEIYFPAVGWSSIKCACTNPPAQPGVISGYTSVCNNQQNVTYSIVPVPGAASYTWTVPSGATIVSGQGTTSIVVNFGTLAGNIDVAASNGCGNGVAQSLAVGVGNPNPAFTYSPGTIAVLSNITFSAQATGVVYAWTFQNGNPGTGNTQNPVVSWANTGTNTVKLVVQSNPACRDSSTQQITVINCPPGSQTFNYTGTIQTFTVPNCVTTLHLDVIGAGGGDNFGLIGQNLGGKGARIQGDFSVTPGQVLNIVVGQRGNNATSGNTANGGGGGGGGSFVWAQGQSVPMAVAGGGGGSSLTNNGVPHYYGKDAVLTNNGGGSRSHDQFSDAPGGIAGADGFGGTAGGKGWNSVLSNPAGKTASSYGGHGGYGGGGGSGANCCGNSGHAAGAGGGYSGGGAGGSTYYYGGGGGGSFNSGANPNNAAGYQIGNGQVVISW